MLRNGDSKNTGVPIFVEFRTSGRTETKVKKRCDSAKGYKKKVQWALNLEDMSLKKWHRYGLEGKIDGKNEMKS